MPRPEMCHRRANLISIRLYDDGQDRNHKYAVLKLKEDIIGERTYPIEIEFGERCKIPPQELIGQDIDIKYAVYAHRNGYRRAPEIQSWICWYVSPHKTRRGYYTSDMNYREIKDAVQKLIKEEEQEEAALQAQCEEYEAMQHAKKPEPDPSRNGRPGRVGDLKVEEAHHNHQKADGHYDHLHYGRNADERLHCWIWKKV